MGVCRGKKQDGKRCTDPIYKCKTCGNHGCKSPERLGCDNRGFESTSKCRKCGKVQIELAR